MEYKQINCNSFNIHTIKTNKFKTIHLEIVFRNVLTKNDLPLYTMLCDILTDSNAIYNTRQQMAVRLEELYKTILYGVNSKVGNQLFTTFISEFIDPKYINEKDYLENVIKFIFTCINNPNQEHGEFNLSAFNVVKKRILMDIDSIKESPEKNALYNALTEMDPNSPTSFRTIGTKEMIEDISREKLYQAYLDLYNHFICDIYIIGNVTDEYVSLIKKYFKNRVIKEKKLPLFIENKQRKRPLVKSDDSNYAQSNLILIFNITHEDNNKNNMVFHAFNSILCNSGLTSILYKRVREENSLCYNIRSMYLRYDKLLIIQVVLDKNNILKAKKIILDSLKDIVKGKLINESLLEDTKQNLKFLINSSKDNNVSILNTYLFKNIDSSPLYDEKLEIVDSIVLKDVFEIAKSLKLNVVYTLLQGGKNE